MVQSFFIQNLIDEIESGSAYCKVVSQEELKEYLINTGECDNFPMISYEYTEDSNIDVDIDDLLGNNPPEKQEKMICTCFQITENVIWDAIKQNGLKTVDEVTNYTKAGGACGKCKSIIKDIIDTYYNKEKQDTQQLTPTQWVLKVNNVIETQISPELQKDGGDIELIDIKDKTNL